MLIFSTWYRSITDGIELYIYAQPSAKKTQIMGLHDGRLKIQLAAPPIEARANQELLRFLKEILHLPLSSLTLARGEKSRKKTVICKGVTEQCLTAIRFTT